MARAADVVAKAVAAERVVVEERVAAAGGKVVRAQARRVAVDREVPAVKVKGGVGAVRVVKGAAGVGRFHPALRRDRVSTFLDVERGVCLLADPRPPHSR